MTSDTPMKNPNLAALYRVSQVLGASLDLDEVLNQVMDALIELTGAERGFLMLLDPQTKALDLRAARNIEKETLDQEDMQVSHTVIKAVLETGEGVITTNAQHDPRFAGQESVVGFALRSILCAPLRARGTDIGVVYVDNRAQEGQFTAQELDLVNAFAAQAAVALENARLYTQTDQALAARVAELEKLNREVEQANQEKSKFVSVVTHELRIPMTSIKGYTDLMRSGVVGEVSDQQLEFLDVIRNNVERMSALISDLSDISRIETGRLNIDLAFITLRDSIDETIEIIRPHLDERKQSLTVDLPEDLPPAYADPKRVVQILTNMLSNANTYPPEEGSISVDVQQAGDFLRISVTDNGIGIAEEDQENVFSQFFRSEDQAVRDEQGWGLGLNVTKQLVELMGGQIGFSSQLGQSSTFWFTLPTEEGEAAEEGAVKALI